MIDQAAVLRARLTEIPGVRPDDRMAEAGRKVLAHHMARLLKEEPGVRAGGSVEAVHDMRVATRRMRSALHVFEPAYRDSVVRPLNRRLRKVARALGAVRDLDVFRLQVADYVATASSDVSDGMTELLAGLQAREDEARADLLAHLESSAYGELIADLAEFVTTPGAGAADHKDDDEPMPDRVCEVAPYLIYQQYGVVRAYERLLGDASLDTLHALRIEAKRLRYTIEAFTDVLGPEAKAAVEATKKLQDYLGELQDSRVSVEKLHEHLKQNGSTPHAGIERYLHLRQDDTMRLRRGVQEAWAAFTAPEVRRALALAVSVL